MNDYQLASNYSLSDRQLKWDFRYLSLAKLISSWSKDPSTKVGAVAVGPDGQILSQGYNGFPRGVTDSDSILKDRELKYRYTIHAEMNCIYNASLSGISLKNSSLYVYGLPMCHECAKGAIQSGVSRVVSAHNGTSDLWSTSWQYSRLMLDETGVTWSLYDSTDIE